MGVPQCPGTSRDVRHLGEHVAGCKHKLRRCDWDSVNTLVQKWPKCTAACLPPGANALAALYGVRIANLGSTRTYYELLIHKWRLHLTSELGSQFEWKQTSVVERNL